MNFLICIHLFLIASICGEKCLTPSGLPGKCVPLASCSSLWWSFSNPRDGSHKILNKFLCSNTEDGGIIVCCHVPTDVLVFEDDDEIELDPIHDIKNLANTKSCGVQTGQVRGDGIVGLYDFPWLVKLIFVNTVNGPGRIERVGCTGVLINERYVLTTAQCEILRQEPYFFVRIEVFVGNQEMCNTTSSSYHNNCSTFQMYQIEDFIRHPFYDHKTKFNDLAMLRLNSRVTFSDYLRPICLPLTPETSDYKITYTANWNVTFTSTDWSVKSSYSSLVISNVECKLKSNTKNFFIPYDMCTNSTSPVEDEVMGYPVMSFHNNHWYIQGFTSRGSQPKINVHIQNYLQWIKESMGGEQCLTPHREVGECIELIDCPRLKDAFANYNSEDEDMLQNFICSYTFEDANDPIKVCCGIMSNFTIVNTSNIETEENQNISDFRYCGYQHRDDYLSYDDRIAIDEFPWLATIVEAPERTPICGGTLINRRYVLTSVQCIVNFKSIYGMLVRFGDYNLKTEEDCIALPEFNAYDCSYIQEYGIEQETRHPFYYDGTFINDIGLLRLNKTVMFSDYVRPICLPMFSTDLVDFGETLYTTGFGEYTKNMETTRLKKKIRTSLMSLDFCKQKLRLRSYVTALTDYHICTEEFENSTDITCVGDEGGPVMFSRKQRWYIIGVSSSFGCGDGRPQSHIKVSKYLKWIETNIEP